MTGTARYERAIERKVADRYRRLGYDVMEQPAPGDLPFDLGGYQPDLLAMKSGERLLIEVKGSVTGISVEQYLEIAELVAHHPGWRFLLVTEEEPMARLAEGGELVPLTWEQMDARMEHAERLRSLGEDEASFLSLWSILEAAMRNRALDVQIPLELVSTTSILNHLYSLGELSMDQFDAAQDLLRTRDLIVHGFHADDVAGSADSLNALVHELSGAWRPGHVSTAGA